MGSEGNISSNMKTEAQNLASIADWYDIRKLDISKETGDVVIATKYPGMVCKRIMNLSDSGAATIIFKTKTNSAGTAITMSLDSRGDTGKLPEVYSIVKAGTADNLLLWFQKL